MKRKGPAGIAFLVPIIYIMAALLLTLWVQAGSPMKTGVDIDDVLGEGVLALISFIGILLLGRISDDKEVYCPLAAGNLLVFIGFYADLLDEFFYAIPPLFG